MAGNFFLYYQEPFNSGTQVDPVDTYVGDGVTTVFTLLNKTGAQLAATIQADNVIYRQFDGGFTKSGNNFTLNSAPGQNVQIMASGATPVVATAFDQNVVDGVTNPRITEVPFYLADVSTIHLYRYLNLPQYNGILISLVNLVTSSGAQLSWCQLASSSAAGLALTYGATGADLYTATMNNYQVCTLGNSAGASALFVVQASSFLAGDYVIINIGNSTQEVRQIAAIPSNSKLVLATNTDFTHAVGESVFTCARKFWLKVTIPTNAASNTAVSLRNLGIRYRTKYLARS